MHTKPVQIIIACVLLQHAAECATNQVLIPLPSVPDFTRGEGWGAVLGAGVEYESAYDGSSDYETEFEPVFALQYRLKRNMLFFEGNELGWRGLPGDRWLLQAGMRYEYGREEDESDSLRGLGDVDDELVGFFETRYAIGDAWRNWVAARIMQGDDDIGSLGILALGHLFGRAADGTGVEAFVFVTVASSEFINRDFGITSKQAARSGLEETDLSGGYRSAGLQAIARYNLSDHFQLLGEAGVERYSSDIADSPIAEDDFEAEVGLSLLYVF
jgi:outer membrane scaffolding protein for murein synthesis (MipA/OmpV family)